MAHHALAIVLSLAAGQIGPREVSKVVAAATPAFSQCASKHMKKAAKLDAILTFAVEPTGAVSEAEATGVAAPLAECLARAARKLKFPVFTGEALVIELPLVLTVE